MTTEQTVSPLAAEAGIGADQMAELLEAVPYEERILPICVIGTDRSYQRALTRQKVSYIASNWDARVAHVLRVNQRADGSYWIMDGQHRLRGSEQAGKSHVLCHVYHVTREDEAALFHMWNTHSTKAGPRDVFRARLVAGDEKAHLIKQLVEDCGFVLDLGAMKTDAPDHIGCVRTLEQLYDDYQPFSGVDYDKRRKARQGPRAPRPERLRQTLLHLRETWPETPGGTNEVIVRAMDRMIQRFGDEVDWPSFHLKVGAKEPRLLAKRAAENSKLLHASADTLVVQEFVLAYNTSRRRSRLPVPGMDHD